MNRTIQLAENRIFHLSIIIFDYILNGMEWNQNEPFVCMERNRQQCSDIDRRMIGCTMKKTLNFQIVRILTQFTMHYQKHADANN